VHMLQPGKLRAALRELGEERPRADRRHRRPARGVAVWGPNAPRLDRRRFHSWKVASNHADSSLRPHWELFVPGIEGRRGIQFEIRTRTVYSLRIKADPLAFRCGSAAGETRRSCTGRSTSGRGQGTGSQAAEERRVARGRCPLRGCISVRGGGNPLDGLNRSPQLPRARERAVGLRLRSSGLTARRVMPIMEHQFAGLGPISDRVLRTT